MGKEHSRKCAIKKQPKPRRLPPIVVVPDKTYIDDAGDVIPTDVILISDPTMYIRMVAVLKAWEEEFAKTIADSIPTKEETKKDD